MAKLALVLAVVSSVGCGSSGANQRLVHMASQHWECPSGKIEVEQIDGETYRVAGCEHEATYACNSSSSNQACTRVSGF
jgi:hypothetical protein